MLPPRNTQVAHLRWYFNPQQTILTYIKLHCTKSNSDDFRNMMEWADTKPAPETAHAGTIKGIVRRTGVSVSA